MTDKEWKEQVSNQLNAILVNQAARSEGPSGKQITLRRVLEVATVAVVLGAIGAGIVLFVLGRITADDVVRGLEAWNG